MNQVRSVFVIPQTQFGAAFNDGLYIPEDDMFSGERFI